MCPQKPPEWLSGTDGCVDAAQNARLGTESSVPGWSTTLQRHCGEYCDCPALSRYGVDHRVTWCLIPVAFWILLSGLDDLFIALVYFARRKEQFPWPTDSQLENVSERRIAIFVPLWREHRVIGQMLEHNLSVIRYSNYEFFVGVYPNDPLTARAVADAAQRHPRVHLAVCGKNGPTSKGDCLNWIYRTMESFERRQGVRYDIVVTHDAEDLVHPESLRLINWFARDFDMVQVPVLALPTPGRELTHGIYCDEFAEYQLKDIPVQTASRRIPALQRSRDRLQPERARRSRSRSRRENLRPRVSHRGLRERATPAPAGAAAALRTDPVRSLRAHRHSRILPATVALRRCGSEAAGWRGLRCRAGSITAGACRAGNSTGYGAIAKA